MTGPLDTKTQEELFLKRLRYDFNNAPEPSRMDIAELVKLNSKDTIQEAVEHRAPGVKLESALGPGVLERIIGESELQPVRFLLRGARTARAVCRVEIRETNGTPLGHGTGSLVAPRVLLTNHHVLESFVQAQRSVAEFEYWENADGSPAKRITFRLKPEELYVANANLDYAIVAVEPENAAGVKLSSRGVVALSSLQAAPLKGQRLNILQHPHARPMEIAVRDNYVVDFLDSHFVHYLTDTQRGSSGSPVFDDEWRLVLLHHAGVSGGNGWIANEGIRLASIIEHVRGVLPSLSSEAQVLARSFLAAATGQEVAEEAAPEERSLPRVVEMRLYVPETKKLLAGPVKFNLALDDKSSQTSEPDMAEPHGPSDKDYYDSVKDAERAAAFYGQIAPTSDPVKSYRMLSELVRSHHQPLVSYSKARHRYLYPVVDVHPNGKLKSVYSGNDLEIADVLDKEAQVERDHRRRMQEVMARENFRGDEMLDLMEMLEAQMPFNCEHVVPQSWFGRERVQRSDLHHLFTCEPACNSFRSNLPYQQFNDEAYRKGCGVREGNGFEPFGNKGAVARATLYFLLRYPGSIGDRGQELQRRALPTLLGWHREEEPTLWEKHRNASIHRIQKNRNPLIDHPEWADKIDFEQGFG